MPHPFVAMSLELRLPFLVRMASIGRRVSKLQQTRVRIAFEKMKHLVPLNILCQSCGRMPATERHHIRPICFGGGNTLDNLVAICEDCHRRIHPWM
jgi:5-methylcytosine-specific restriction endonuclease McrA